MGRVRQVRRVWLATLMLLLLFCLAALVATISGMAVNAASTVQQSWPLGLDTLRDHPFRWAAGLVPAAGVLGFLMWKVQAHAERYIPDRLPPPPPIRPVEDWVVGRPTELDKIASALRRRSGRMVGITTALRGTGGFGKTTLANVVCHDRRIRRRFNGRIYPITIGRDVDGQEAIAGRVNELIGLITGVPASHADPRIAGQHLGRLLDTHPRMLLVLDDVWTAKQLAPFQLGGPHSSRLVTTRLTRGELPDVVPVEVDQMSLEQARAVLMRGLELPSDVVVRLLARTGRWPLLLRIVNEIVRKDVATGMTPEGAAVEILERLEAAGPGVVDDPLSELDVDDVDQRGRAVRATIEASTGLLRGDGAERFAELAIFAEDESIPLSLVETLWHATAGLTPDASRGLCRELVGLALIGLDVAGGGVLTVHDVIRDFLRGELGPERIRALNVTLLDALAAQLPAATDTRSPSVAWWEAVSDHRYLADHLISHLVAADRVSTAEATVCDLRWIEARLVRHGAAAPQRDLSLVRTPRAMTMRVAISRVAHLLSPTEPEVAVQHILRNHLLDDPNWGPQVTARQPTAVTPRLACRWPLPKFVDPATLRMLVGHTEWVSAMAVAPDGTWLVTADSGLVRIWDMATGAQLRSFSDQGGGVTALAIAPDGSRLATGSYDGRVRLWDPASGDLVRTLRGRLPLVTAVTVERRGDRVTGYGRTKVRVWEAGSGAIVRTFRDYVARQLTTMAARDGDAVVAHHGGWVATTGGDGTVQVWDSAMTTPRTSFHQAHPVTMMASAPDDSWTATDCYDTVPVWNPSTGNLIRTLIGHTSRVTAMSVAQDGSWLASGSDDGTVRIWDPTTTGVAVDPTGKPHGVTAMAASSDGTWLATISREVVHVRNPVTGIAYRTVTCPGGTRAVCAFGARLLTVDFDAVRVWDTTAEKPLAVIDRRVDPATAIACAPTGDWLAVGRYNGTVDVWRHGVDSQTLDAHASTMRRVTAIVAGPTGDWLVVSNDTIRIWDPVTGNLLRVLPTTRRVTAMALAPDGCWLAVGTLDGTVEVWETATGTLAHTNSSHADIVTAVAIAPGGDRIASCDKAGVIRVWPPDLRRCAALMRTDDKLRVCTWMPNGELMVGGDNGLYSFTFESGRSSRHVKSRQPGEPGFR